MADFKLFILAILTTYNSHKFKLDGIIRFLNEWDWHDLVKESFIFPLIAFFFLKILEGFFGRAVTVKNFGSWLRKRFDNIKNNKNEG